MYRNHEKLIVLVGLMVVLVSGLLYAAFADSTTVGANPHSTSTPFPTQMPLPERPETLADIQRMLQEMGEICQLPCFWGFRPGDTTEEEIVEFLQPVAIGNNAPELHYAFSEDPEQESLFYINFGVTDGVVSLTTVILDRPSEWLPPQTLELPYLLSTTTSVPYIYSGINITTRRIFITIIRDGVYAQYAFELHIEGALLESNLHFCPVPEENPLILFRLRDQDADFLVEEYGIPEMVSRNKTWPIERMTGMEVQEFVDQIIESPNECIELPSYSELVEMGYEF